VEIQTVKIEKPEAINFILGQSHFIKTVEDIHEALVSSVPGITFGLAFCEASGKCLIRWTGTDETMVELAKQNAQAVGAGHSFILFLGEGFYPINVLNAVKNVPEVARIFCATANPTQVLVAQTEQGRGILGVVDGFSPQGIEDESDTKSNDQASYPTCFPQFFSVLIHYPRLPLQYPVSPRTLKFYHQLMLEYCPVPPLYLQRYVSRSERIR
jgi:adenosine/AMP kinase